MITIEFDEKQARGDMFLDGMTDIVAACMQGECNRRECLLFDFCGLNFKKAPRLWNDRDSKRDSEMVSGAHT